MSTISAERSVHLGKIPTLRSVAQAALFEALSVLRIPTYLGGLTLRTDAPSSTTRAFSFVPIPTRTH